jgi:hypothetical protein
MAIGFPAGITQQMVVNNAQAKLANLRRALQDCEEFYQNMVAPYAITDLEAAPINLDAVSAQAIFNALTDAHNEYVNHVTGLPASLPATGYKYGASQNVVIGPLS